MSPGLATQRAASAITNKRFLHGWSGGALKFGVPISRTEKKIEVFPRERRSPQPNARSRIMTRCITIALLGVLSLPVTVNAQQSGHKFVYRAELDD